MKKFCDEMDYILKDAKMNDIQKLFEVSAKNNLDEKKYPWVYDITKLLYNHKQASTTSTIFFHYVKRFTKKSSYILINTVLKRLLNMHAYFRKDQLLMQVQLYLMITDVAP